MLYDDTNPIHKPPGRNKSLSYYNTWFILDSVKKIKKKVKVTLVQALRLCTGRKAYTGSSGIALPFHDHGTRRGWGVSLMSRPLFNPEKDPVPIVHEARWAPGPVWTGAENLAHTGIRSPGRPARYTDWATRPTFDPQTVQLVACRYIDWATLPKFDPRAVQPVASRYTDWATRPALDTAL